MITEISPNAHKKCSGNNGKCKLPATWYRTPHNEYFCGIHIYAPIKKLEVPDKKSPIIAVRT